MSIEPRTFTFEFHGRVDIIEEQTPTPREVVVYLDSESESIAEEIKYEIGRALPPSVNIETQISFDLGSVTWDGMVVIVDWMGRLAGEDFGEALLHLVRIAVDQSVKRRLAGRHGSFRVILKTPVETEVTLMNASLRTRWDSTRTVVLLTSANAVLLVALVVATIVR